MTTDFLRAVKHGDVIEVRRLLAAGANHAKTLRFLLGAGADVNASYLGMPYSMGRTAPGSLVSS
jgi:hypothetical protein